MHLQDSLESLGSLMASRQTSTVPGLPQNASSRAGLGNLKRLGSSRGRLDVKVQNVSHVFGGSVVQALQLCVQPQKWPA